ncbi:MAG: metallophosphoesterase [Candidatus Aenigmatarchaeota archaeon]
MGKYKFLHGKPAMVIETKEDKILVVGDLHLGFEYEIYKSGISLPSKMKDIKKQILGLITETNSDRIILLGDVKHNIPNTSWQERKEIPELLESLSNRIRVDVTPGNHDGNLEELAPDNVKIHPRSGFKLEEFYFCHGHAWPKPSLLESKYLVMSHIHSSVEFRDELGYRSVKRCWVRGNMEKEKMCEKYNKEEAMTKKGIIVPVFNSLVSGVPVNRNKKENEEYISPLIRNGMMNFEESEIYMLDGTHLGKLKNLELER